MASNPSAAKRKFPADAADAPLMVATDARVLAKLPFAALAAWCVPERLWDGLAYGAAESGGRVGWGAGPTMPRDADGPQPRGQPGAALDRARTLVGL